jgi:methyl-accepting chemotaxis protein
MTVIAIALVVIAICQVAWLATAIVAELRARALMRRAEPVIAKTNEIAEHVNRIAARIQEMAEIARRVEGRVAGTADRVLDEIEPPIRQMAAVMAGVRAGVGRLFDRRAGNHHQDGSLTSPTTRRV